MARSRDIAYRYATALLDAAGERGALSVIRREIDGLEHLLEASEEFQTFLNDRIIPPDAKIQILSQIFQGKVEEITLNFLLVVASRKREHLLKDILAACHSILDEREGIVNVEVKSAVSLSQTQQDLIKSRLESYTSRKIRMHTSLEPAMIGGFVVRVGDIVFDGSLSVQLQRIRHALIGH